MGAPDFYNVAPDCIQHGLPPGIPFSAEIMKPYEGCRGFFTFGPGRDWAFGGYVNPIPEGGHVGSVNFDATAGIYTLTAIGFAVSILAFIAWVWFEHRKLMDRAEKLRAAGTPEARGPYTG